MAGWRSCVYFNVMVVKEGLPEPPARRLRLFFGGVIKFTIRLLAL